MSLQHFGKGALRVAKNYTKGYSDVQAKVRDATSNDPWGPSGTQMNEIAQMTFNQQDFVEIMEMLDKRLNDKGRNWRHVFKALTLLDYLLHAGSENVVLYFRDNIYVVKTLKEFQFIDEDMKDQGANVRQKAKDVTNLLTDESRLRDQRRSRAHMRDRMLSGEGRVDDGEDENERRRSQSVPARNPRRTRKEDEDLQKALELSRRSLADEQARQGVLTAEERDLVEALKRSQEEEEARLKAVDDSNSRALFDEGTQLAAPNNNPFPLVDTSGAQQNGLQPQFTANPYWQQQQLAAMQQQQQQQAEYEWMVQQQQLQQQQVQQAQLQQAQNDEWMRQQMLLQQQQQQLLQQQQRQHQQSLFAASPVQVQPTGYGSNNPFALAAGTANISSAPPPVPSFQTASPAFGSTSSAFGNGSSSLSPAPEPPRPQSAPQQPPSPTTANTLANGRRPHVITSDKHSELNNLFANRDDGIDSFGNFGNLRFGHAFAGQLQTQQTGTNNPFGQQQQQRQQGNEQPFFQI